MSTHEKLRAAGARLANCAYNLAHCARLNGDERRSLDEARRDWDAAIAAQPSPVVKQNLTTQPAAAQEAVGWFTDDYLTDKSATTYDPLVAERWRNKGWPVTALYAAPVTAAPEAVAWQVGDEFYPSESLAIEAIQQWGPSDAIAIPLYAAAPVTAAPTLDDELAQDRMSELCKLESDVLDVLPSVYYMDPPDGGDVSLGEQVKRMAEDAASWRKHASTPAAPGIDLVPDILTDLSQVAGSWVVEAAGASADAQNECAIQMHEAIERWSNRLNLGDASPKGGHPAGTPMMQPGQFYDGCWKMLPEGVQNYGRMLTQSWMTADSTELKAALEAGVLALMDSPKGGSCATCNGHGAVGGLLPAGGGYESEPCPDCSPKGGSEAHSAPDAIDMDNRLRSYPWTYRNQPGNVGASVLGGCARRAQPGGDSIDHGLSLLRELHIQGLGIVRVPKLDVGTKASDAEVRP